MSRWKDIALRLDELNHAQGVPTGQAASDERWAIHQQIHDLVGGCPSDVPYCNTRKTLAAWARGRANVADKISDSGLAFRMNLTHDGDRLREIADLLEIE